MGSQWERFKPKLCIKFYAGTFFFIEWVISNGTFSLFGIWFDCGNLKQFLKLFSLLSLILVQNCGFKVGGWFDQKHLFIFFFFLLQSWSQASLIPSSSLCPIGRISSEKKTSKRCQDGRSQCDQIGQFIGLRATFQSLWQQLFCPNLWHS